MAVAPDHNAASPSSNTVSAAQLQGLAERNRFGRAKIDPMNDATRPLPSSHEAERGVLSCMLQAPDLAVGLAAERLSSASFHLEQHQLLFDEIVRLNDGTKPVDFVGIVQALTDKKWQEHKHAQPIPMIDKLGGAPFIAEIFKVSASPQHLDHYINIVEEKHTLRQIITACSRCINRAFEEQENIEPLVDEVEEAILGIRQSRQEKEGTVSLKERVKGAISRLQIMISDPESLQGIPTGFVDLDKMTGGLHAGDMFVIAARPSMGKTSLVMNIVEHVCVDQGLPAAVFSLEMSADQLVQRLLCSRARVNARNLEKGAAVNRQFFRQLTEAGKEIIKSTLLIDDTPSLSITELRSKARRFHKVHGIRLIAIDYLQLMRSTSRRAADNRQQEIAEISAGLKAIAKELKVPVIVLAQLNRNPESRTGKSAGKPRLSDLRESGSIEQDADIVGLLYRKAYYAEDEAQRQENKGISELLIGKHRNGPTGSVPLTFLDEIMRFESRAREAHEADG